MFSPEELDKLTELFASQFRQGTGSSNQNKFFAKSASDNKSTPPLLTPQKFLVILGLLGGVLEVRSVLIDRNQRVEVVLDGSLKRKTKLDKMLDEIGTMPFDDVLRAIIGRF